MQRLTIVSATLTLLTLTAAPTLAGGKEFDFKDPKGVNTMYFLLDSTVEPIMGLASGVSGKVSFNPDDPDKTLGELSVETASLHTQNPSMTETLHNADWLDAAANPTISFRIKGVKDAKKIKDDVFALTLVGDFTCRGVTKELTVPVQAALLRDGAGKRMRNAKGDLLVLRAEFTIKRQDFGIKPDAPGDVVAEEIQIRACIAGMAGE